LPIKIPNNLPARETLAEEGVMVLTEDAATRQDIRPMRIALLNLMPDKIRTETQMARLIGATPLQVEMTLVRITNHQTKNTSRDHMLAFYRPWEDIRDEKFDGLIITGAPVELYDFSEVTYWDEMTRILDWSQENVHSTMSICWGAQAAIHHFHNVPKYTLPQKSFGVYRHRNRNPASPFLRGFSDNFSIPVSRWTEVHPEDLPQDQGLEILMESEEAGLCLVHDPKRRYLYMFNHIEYDSSTLGEEFWRDRDSENPVQMPANYFPEDNTRATPVNRWRSQAHLFFGNWINEMYQSTPFTLEDVGNGGDK